MERLETAGSVEKELLKAAAVFGSNKAKGKNCVVQKFIYSFLIFKHGQKGKGKGINF